MRATSIAWTAFNVIAGISSILGLIVSLPPAGSAVESNTIILGLLTSGLIAAFLHGVMWARIELYCGWEFGGGGGSRMPTGIEAVVLSLTMTLPLAIAPALAQLLLRLVLDRHTIYLVIPSGHIVACVVIIVCSAVGHLLLYGSRTPNFSGLKSLIFPIGSSANTLVAAFMEFIYGVVHFSSIALAYRLVVNHTVTPTLSMLSSMIPFAFIWFFIVLGYIFLVYPRSLIHPRWMEFRGFLSALFLMVCLTFAMLT